MKLKARWCPHKTSQTAAFSFNLNDSLYSQGNPSMVSKEKCFSFLSPTLSPPLLRWLQFEPYKWYLNLFTNHYNERGKTNHIFSISQPEFFFLEHENLLFSTPQMAMSSDSFQSYNVRACGGTFKHQRVWFLLRLSKKDVPVEYQPDDSPRILKSGKCCNICRRQFGPLLGEVAKFPVHCREEFLPLHHATTHKTINFLLYSCKNEEQFIIFQD